MPELRVGYQCVTLPSATAMPCGTAVRLACLKHAASVHPELGSNSQKIKGLSLLYAHILSKIFKERIPQV